MATIAEIARRAALPTWTVLKVVRREPTSKDVARRVADAIAVLGPPDHPQAAAMLPAEVSAAAVVEAFRVEVRPVGEEVAALRRLHEEVIARLERERSDRVGELELVTELIAEGWQSVDRRLGRIERMLERLELEREEKPARSHLSGLQFER